MTWSVENLLCVSDLHTDISNIISWYGKNGITEWKHGRASWWSLCLGIVWLVCTSHLCFLFIRETKCYLCHYRQAEAYRVGRTRRPHFLLLPSTKEQVHVFARVRLSVCLLARLLKNTCMDLHKMLRVDRCQDTDNWLTFQSDLYSLDAGTTLLSPISYKRYNMEFYYVGKIPRIRIGCPSLQQRMLLKWIIHRKPLEHLRRKYMRSTECTSSS